MNRAKIGAELNFKEMKDAAAKSKSLEKIKKKRNHTEDTD